MKTEKYVYHMYLEYYLDGEAMRSGYIHTNDQKIDSIESFKDLINLLKKDLNCDSIPCIKSLSFLHTKTE